MQKRLRPHEDLTLEAFTCSDWDWPCLWRKLAFLTLLVSSDTLNRLSTETVYTGLHLLFITELLRVSITQCRTHLQTTLHKTRGDMAKEVVFITGGSREICEALALRLATKSKVIIIFDLAPSAIYYINSVADTINKEHGNSTVLVNNAGTTVWQYVTDMNEFRLRRRLLASTSFCTSLQSNLPAMVVANNGHIVTLPSIASFVTPIHMLDCCATKAGTLAFHEGLACELREIYITPKGRTTIVHTNWIKTAIAATVVEIDEIHEFVLNVNNVIDAIEDFGLS
ncbi:hypothetical protein V1512DRAFT_254724 [Lipomyces arxii]|uniref:uncharacterized protein n=1 Tax=Lipomyces arxii TaxID=56418 RepID=UPI0034CE03BC